MPLIHPFTHTFPFTHQRRLAAMQGTDQLVRSNWGSGVLLRDTSTRPGWDPTGNPPTARRQLLPPEPYRPYWHVSRIYTAFCAAFKFTAQTHTEFLFTHGALIHTIFIHSTKTLHHTHYRNTDSIMYTAQTLHSYTPNILYLHIVTESDTVLIYPKHIIFTHSYWVRHCAHIPQTYYIYT